MTPDRIPEAVVARFRALSLERTGRIEATWNLVFQGGEDPAAVRQMMRDVHTLKGDARIVGFDDVHVLTHKLEELLALAGERRYQVSDDFELAVTMGVQFLGMLLRMKPGSSTAGLDLVGFLRQVDDVVRETRAMPARRRGSSIPHDSGDAQADRLAEPTRQRLAIAATLAYLELVATRDEPSRERLRGVWDLLRGELTRIRSSELAPVFERQVGAAHQLATELGKRVEIALDLGGVRADSRAAEAIDIAVLHAISNAIDHGLEAPDARAAAGKPAVGTIRIVGRETASSVQITVEDDGAGVDLPAVRARAIAAGLLGADRAARATDAELLALLFQPGFSTRTEVSDVSGRGVGMDAIRAALVRVGGHAAITSVPGRGTTVELAVPAPTRQIHAYRFLAPGGDVALAVSDLWTPSVEPCGADAIDPMCAIQLVGRTRRPGTELTAGAAALAVRLRWGFLEVSLAAGSEPVLAIAERICPTPDDYPAEVLLIDGRETLRLRPQYLGLAGSRAGRTAATR